jgi:uncharacterized RDD family membrane protein YckC
METTTLDASATQVQVERQGFGIRLGAMLIDAVLLCILIAVLAPLLGGLLGGMIGASAAGGDDTTAALGGFMGAIAGMLIVAPIVVIAYYLMEALIGATPGKMMLGIKIASEDGTAAPVSKLFMRWVIKSAGNILSILGLLAGVAFLGTLGTIAGLVIFIGCFMVLGEKRQAIHDMLGKTAVFKKSDIR